jgi:hypothetical protein
MTKKSISSCLSESSRWHSSRKNDCHQFSFVSNFWCISGIKAKPRMNTPKYQGSCSARLKMALVNSDVRAVRLETASVDGHVLSRSVASCIFNLRTLFKYINGPGWSCMFRLLGLKLRSENSGTFFPPSQGLLHHTQASQGSLNRGRSIGRYLCGVSLRTEDWAVLKFYFILLASAFLTSSQRSLPTTPFLL